MKKYAKSMPCRECFYRKKSLSKEIQGSFISQSKEAYFFVLNGIQFYCHRECTEKYITHCANDKIGDKSNGQN